MRKKAWIILALIFLLVMASCKIKRGVSKDEKFEPRGTDGIVINFLPNFPPGRITIGGTADREFAVAVEMKNKGAYPERGSPDGKLFIGGFDRNIIKFNDFSIDFKDKFLEGRSLVNKGGGYELAEFKGKVLGSKIPPSEFPTTFSVTACYGYETLASIPVCVDSYPYSDDQSKKVCRISPISPPSQGAPIAITSVDEEVLTDSIQFRITIKNMGNGDVLNSPPDDCDPYNNKVKRDNFDLVKLAEVKLSDTTIGVSPSEGGVAKSSCRPSILKDGNSYIRLVNGEGFFICSVDITPEMKQQAYGYTAPLQFDFKYTYRNIIQKEVNIVKAR